MYFLTDNMAKTGDLGTDLIFCHFAQLKIAHLVNIICLGVYTLNSQILCVIFKTLNRAIQRIFRNYKLQCQMGNYLLKSNRWTLI